MPSDQSMTHHDKDVTPSVWCEASASQVGEMTGKSDAWVAGMLIHRQGTRPDANMTAIGLHAIVKRDETYAVSTLYGLRPVVAGDRPIDLESETASQAHDQPPDHTTVAAIWDTHAVVERGQENILGDNVIFRIQTQAAELEIPVIDANSHDLGYYGALLVDEGVRVRFPNPEYPIWKMELGVTYIDGFIMTPQGKGFYLEYHRDRPHWHQPLTEDGGGYYILAREAGADADGVSQFHMTGFRIPYGKAVYTRLGAIHCDAALTGRNWLVGYTDSEDFSSALVRNANEDFVRISALPRAFD